MVLHIVHAQRYYISVYMEELSLVFVQKLLFPPDFSAWRGMGSNVRFYLFYDIYGV